MKQLKSKIKNFKNSFKRNGIKTEIRRMRNYIKNKRTVPDEYKEWIVLNEPDKKEIERQRKYVSFLNTKFLIILPNKEAEEKIGKQTYRNYETIVATPETYEEEIKKHESDYCLFVGKGIKLQEFALFSIQDFIEHNECNVIYADNDWIKEGKRLDPEFKPHFAYHNMLSKNYVGNFLTIKTKFLEANVEVLENINKSEPIYDLLLRVIEKDTKIRHIDQCLYHKEEEIVDIKAQKEIIENHLKRMGEKYDRVEDGKFKGQYKINYIIEKREKVSIVIPNMDHLEDLKKCINSILKSTYTNYEIIIVENNSKKEETFAYYKELERNHRNIKVVKMKIQEFNYSKIVNYGVKQAEGRYIVMLNNDIELLTPDWLEQMLMYVQKENIGICGARLYFSDNSIQHAGVTIGIRGLAGHKYRAFEKDKFSEKDSISYIQDLSAVTAACFMVKKEDYEKVLGFDEKLKVAFNDVDFCLKIRKQNQLIVYNPFIEAYHYESKSRGEDTENKEKQERFAREYAIFVKRWYRTIGKGDPYFNINYRLDTDIPQINYNKIH